MQNPNANPVVEAHLDLVASLPSTILIDEGEALALRAISDRRVHLEKTLQSAIQAAVEAAQQLGYQIDEELRNLWQKTLIAHNADTSNLNWAVDAADPKRAYLYDNTELSAAQASTPAPFAVTRLHLDQAVVLQIRADLEGELGREVSYEELQKRIDETYGVGAVVLDTTTGEQVGAN